MPLVFHTKNINERLYTRLFRDYIYDMFDVADENYMKFIKNWWFHVYPSDMAPNDPHFDGQQGVGGVTGMYNSKVYIEDVKTDLIHDIFKRALRQNMKVISHELAHSLLLMMGMTHRVPLRHNDTSGHAAGTMLNFSTAEVHDRESEGMIKNKNVWFWDWKTMLISRLYIQVVDIDDLL